MMATIAAARLRDLTPSRSEFRDDVLDGLRQPQKSLPCKYFYDERGSTLFEKICRLEEYYLTRTELTIMRENIEEMVEAVGSNCLLIEYGSGSSLKTRLLLDHLPDAAGYVPVDISKQHLLRACERMQQEFPRLEILPVCADFTEPFDLPCCSRPVRRHVVYFPGSTIGNFTRPKAVTLLKNIARQCPAPSILIGVDLRKEPTILERAYDDRAGVTAAFNLNVLARMNRELDADFDLDNFEHKAIYVPHRDRVEMHLISTTDQEVRLGEETIGFAEGEAIHTENSHKYTIDQFRLLAQQAGFQVDEIWMDGEQLFSVQFLTVTVSPAAPSRRQTSRRSVHE